MHTQDEDSVYIIYSVNRVDKYPRVIQNHAIMDVPKDTNITVNSYEYVSGLWGVRTKLQGGKTTTQYIGTCKMLIDTTIYDIP